MPEGNDTGERRRAEQHRLLRLKDDAWLFVRENWKTVLAGILGFVIGYWKLRSDIAGAITAAHTAERVANRLQREVEQLATKQALDLTNKRIDDWNIWYARAGQIAGQNPQPRPKAPVPPSKGSSKR